MGVAITLIVLTLAFIIAGIMRLRPSVEDRRRMRLRNQAYRRGWRVEKVRGAALDELGESGSTGAYYWYWRSWPSGWFEGESASVGDRHVLSGGEGVSGVPGMERLPAVPSVCTAWVVEPRGIGFVWDESGTMDDLERPFTMIESVLETGDSDVA